MFEWEVTPEQHFEELFNNYAQAIFLTGRRVAEKRAHDMELWAKENAPWTDQTGNARMLLTAFVDETGGSVSEIRLTHGVTYGVWLEIANGGKYAIIAPAIDYWGGILWRDIQNMMNLGIVVGG